MIILLHLEVGDTYTDAGATASDASGSATVTSTFASADIIHTITASDPSGNTAEQSITYTVT